MYYLINDTGTTIQVPDWQRIYYKDLTLIGKKTTDWNAPIQENFLKIVDRLTKIEQLLAVPEVNKTSYLGLLNLDNSPEIIAFVDTPSEINKTSYLGLLNLDNSPEIISFDDIPLEINKTSYLGLLNLYIEEAT